MSVDVTAVLILLALQAGALFWRIAREVDGRDPNPFPWVPVPDNVNVAAMLAVLALCLVAPLVTTGQRLYAVGVLSRATFVAATVLIVFHPLVVASHYGLWAGRRAASRKAEARYCTGQEAIVQLVALGIAATVFVLVLRAANAATITLTAVA